MAVQGGEPSSRATAAENTDGGEGQTAGEGSADSRSPCSRRRAGRRLPPFRTLCYAGHKTEAIAPTPQKPSPFEDTRLMTNALDKGYNEGRLAFRRYFAKYGPNVKQNDPRMPPNPYVGYSGFAWLSGFESELRRHVVFTPSTNGFHDIGDRLPFR
jgi:hypothetical protein